ncbi:unnamed protein product [Lathyrus oleraceus]
MLYTMIYGLGKECSCELRQGIKTEETVKSVVGPVHEKFSLVPDAILLRHIDPDHDHRRLRHRTPVAQCEHAASTWPEVKQSSVFHHVGNAVAPNTVYLRSSATKWLPAHQRRVARPQCICLWCIQRGI